MRKKNSEIFDKVIVNEILENSQICRIAMLDNNEPYIVPVYFAYKNDKLVIHSALQGRKLDILRKSELVCFEMELPSMIIKNEEACKWTSKYRSIIGYGKAKIITDYSKKKSGLDIIMAKYGGVAPFKFKDSSINSMVLIEISIDSLTAKQLGEW